MQFFISLIAIIVQCTYLVFEIMQSLLCLREQLQERGYRRNVLCVLALFAMDSRHV